MESPGDLFTAFNDEKRELQNEIRALRQTLSRLQEEMQQRDADLKILKAELAVRCVSPTVCMCSKRGVMCLAL